MNIDRLVAADFLEGRWRDGKPSAAAAWLASHSDLRLGLTWTVKAEFWRLGLQAGVEPAAIRSFLRRYPTYVPDDETVLRYARLRQSGVVLPDADLWTAAAALCLGVPLVTRRVHEYAEVPDLMVDPY